MKLTSTPMAPLALATTLVAAACSVDRGSPPAASPWGEIGPLFSRLLTEADVPGGAFAILGPGAGSEADIEIHVAGRRSLLDDEAVREDDCFYIGSLTKTYVATVVLQLVDEGRLLLDATLSDYLPEIPRAERITIRQLLNHTAGMEGAYLHLYYLPLDEMLAAFSRPWTKAELLDLGTGLPPRFEPGSDYYYSGTHYDVLATVVERVTGSTLEGELQHRIFDPLDLERTWMGLGRAPPECLVTGHLAPTDFWEHSKTLYPELTPSTNIDEPMKAWAAGGLGSTAAEMLRFGQALFEGELLPDHLLAEMSTFLDPRDVSNTSRDPRGFGYGLGLIHVPRETYRRIGHGGMYSGYTVGLWKVPEADAIVALLLNRGLFFGERKLLDELIGAMLAAQLAAGPN